MSFAHKYKLISKIGEGTFSEVLKALNTKTGKLVAIKRMKSVFRTIEQVNNLREIQALKRLQNHPNIIKLLEVMYDRQTGRLAFVFELMTCNLYEIIKNRKIRLPEAKVKLYIYQTLRALDFLHKNGIFHRDIKPENILFTDDLIKLADLGSCRGMYTKPPFSEYISTRWYRAPECLLTDGYYNYKMDIWGLGCVFFEMIMLYPLFPGSDEVDQIHRIHSVIGTPTPQILSKFKKSAHMDFNFPQTKGCGLQRLMADASPELLDILMKMLSYDPDDRFSARQCLRHVYFSDLREADLQTLGIISQVMSPSPTTTTTPGYNNINTPTTDRLNNTQGLLGGGEGEKINGKINNNNNNNNNLGEIGGDSSLLKKEKDPGGGGKRNKEKEKGKKEDDGLLLPRLNIAEQHGDVKGIKKEEKKEEGKLPLQSPLKTVVPDNKVQGTNTPHLPFLVGMQSSREEGRGEEGGGGAVVVEGCGNEKSVLNKSNKFALSTNLSNSSFDFGKGSTHVTLPPLIPQSLTLGTHILLHPMRKNGFLGNGDEPAVEVNNGNVNNNGNRIGCNGGGDAGGGCSGETQPNSRTA